MKVETAFNEGRLKLLFSGELDHHAARRIMAEIENNIDVMLPRDCVIDMAKVTFMDSSGIAVILKTHRRMNEIGGRVWVENVPKQPMRVIDTAGIERLIKVSALADGQTKNKQVTL